MCLFGSIVDNNCRGVYNASVVTKGRVGLESRTFLPVVAGAVLILTLFFAAVAGAQETTTPETTSTTPATNTSTAAQEATTADADSNAGESVREADNFRCEFFLRTARDDTGALRAQYRDGDRDDELIVQRFEQCVAGDVLADTIPDRRLPFTGGMPLLGLSALGLASLVVGGAMLRAVMRREG